MMMGILLLGRHYTPLKYLSVLMITVGIITCTYSSTINKNNVKESSERGFDDQFWLALGISLLTFALIISARMGIYQEAIYRKYGKHPKEALFYTHALPLPGFLLLSADILHHWNLVISSDPINIFSIFPVPCLLVYLLGNILTHYLCIFSVFV